MDLNTASVQTMVKLVGLAAAYDLYLWRPHPLGDPTDCLEGRLAPRSKCQQADTANVRCLVVFPRWHDAHKQTFRLGAGYARGSRSRTDVRVRRRASPVVESPGLSTVPRQK